jgi:hypothetical protein
MDSEERGSVLYGELISVAAFFAIGNEAVICNTLAQSGIKLYLLPPL